MASEQQKEQEPPQQQPIQPPADVVGNAFVHQYYLILHQSPELVHRFYLDGSKLGRPEPHGDMGCVTTMEAINEKILSLEYENCKAEIKTIDSQESHDGGVFVLVTGYLAKADDVKRSFAQSFFLAPQDNGFFVLNDIFRYLEEEAGVWHVEPAPPNEPEHDAPPSIEQEEVPEQRELPQEEDQETNIEEVCNSSENEDGSVVDEEVPVAEVVDEVPNNLHDASESSVNIPQEEAPKKSYASIVKVMKENVAPVLASASTAVKQVPVKSEAPLNPPQPQSSVPESTASNPSTTSSGGSTEATDSYSIYIKNLPMHATPEQLEEEFKRFGPIKSDGIQVRSHKQSGFCFGFVEFEVASAVQSAIEASPINIGGKQAYCEEKRPGSRANRGRYIPGRGGYRYDGNRGAGSYGSGRGYGRGDYRSDYGRGDYSRNDYGNRGGRVPSGRGEGGGYQRVDYGNRASFNSKNVSPRVPAPA